MYIEIPEGSPRSADAEATDFKREVTRAGLDATVAVLRFDAKINQFSVEFEPGTMPAQQAKVHAILRGTVSAWEIDGHSDMRPPISDEDEEEEDYEEEEEEEDCPACNGRLQDENGDVCPECNGIRPVR